MLRRYVPLASILTVVLTALFFAPAAMASKDADREVAGMKPLGIGTTFGRWQDGVVQWWYNSSGKATFYSDDAAFVALLQQAMDEIEDAAGVDFQYMGATAAPALTLNDNMVVVGWDNLNGAAGVAGPATFCLPPEVTDVGYCPYKDGSVRFNNDILDIDWDKGDTEASDRTLLNVALHELLHLLGIGHSDEPISIMYANPYTNLHQLRADDIGVLQSLYGLSAAPAPTTQYVVPPDNVGAVILDSYLAVQGDVQTPITSVDDSETAGFVGVTWQENGNTGHSPIHIVATGPAGFFYSKRVEVETCPSGFICTYWYSMVSMGTLRTYPGMWKAHLIVDGDLDITHTLDNQFTPPVINQAPVSSIDFDVVAGESPLTVTATLDITSDNEGDTASATWHIPTDGETAFDPVTLPDQDVQQVTFTTDGDYEIYVEVTDDGSRYGTPGSGAEAGPGFRKLYRQVINVGPQPQETLERVVSVPNIGESAAPELGVVLSGSINGHVRDAGTDALIRDLTYNGTRTPLDSGVADINGAPALAVLERDATGRAWVEVRDAATGTLVRDVWFSSGYTPLAMAVLPDMNGNSISEVAVLLTKDSDNRAWVHIKDAATLAVVSTVWFQSGYTPLDLEFVPNVDGNAGPELAVLMTRNSDGRTWVHTKDAQTGAPVRDNWFAAAHTPKDLAVIDNLDGNPGAELAVLFTRDSDSRTWVHMKDTLTGAYVKNVWFDAGFTPTRLEVVPDLDTNVGDELAVLTTKDADGRAWVLVKDALSGAVIRNVWFQGGFDPKDFAVLPEMDANAGSELAVLGEKTGGQMQVEIKDAKTNAFINQVNFP